MIQNLVSLRFVFIFLIYLSHISYMGFPTFDFGGESGASFFFILSGFVLSLKYGEPVMSNKFEHKRFVVHQLSKFYPLHIVILIVATIFNYKNVDGEYLLHILPSIILVQSWLLDPKYYFAGNAVSWFLSDIVFLYLVFPYAYKLIVSKKYFLIATALILYFVYVAITPKYKYNDCVYAFPLSRLIDFSLGIITYQIYRKLENKFDKGGHGYMLEILAIVVSIITYIVYPSVDSRIHCAALLWPMSISVILAFSISERQRTPFTRILQSSPMLLCGTISFEFFLLHPLVNWNLFVVLRKVGISSWLLLSLTICVLGIIGISWLVNRYFTGRMAKVFCKYVKI